MKKLRLLLCFILCLGLALCSGCGSRKQQENTPKAETSDPEKDLAQNDSDPQEPRVQMPDFEMTLLGGETVSFSDYQGKKVILNFWATWCGPCVREMPAFQRLTEDYPDELVVLAVNCNEDPDTLNSFVEKNGYTFPIVLDEEGVIQSMFGGLTSIPVTIIIDEDGYIVTSHVGAGDADTMYEMYQKDLGL